MKTPLTRFAQCYSAEFVERCTNARFEGGLTPEEVARAKELAGQADAIAETHLSLAEHIASALGSLDKQNDFLGRDGLEFLTVSISDILREAQELHQIADNARNAVHVAELAAIAENHLKAAKGAVQVQGVKS